MGKGPVHLRGQPRRGVGGGRVLDRALLARGPGRLARDPPALRVALSTGREDHARGVLPLDVRALRARAAGEGGSRRPGRRSSTCAGTGGRDRRESMASRRPWKADGTDVRGREETVTSDRSRRASAADRSAGYGRRDRRWSRPPWLQHPVAEARAVLGDARRVGLGGVATPTYARTHVHHSLIDHDRGEYVLLPTSGCRRWSIRARATPSTSTSSPTHTTARLPRDAERIGVAPTSWSVSRPRSAGS